jgi:hypothetical protein
MQFTEQQLAVLDAIAAGLPVRNAREVVAALRLKSDMLLAKPTSAVDHRVGVILVQNPYATEDEDLKALAAPVVAAALPSAEESQPSDDAAEDEDAGDEE